MNDYINTFSQKGLPGPGFIEARNKETGTYMPIRPDMLRIEGHPWELTDKGREALEAYESKQKGEADTPTEKDPRLILTKDNKPFKTEASARQAMAKQKLDENEWIVLPSGDEGFIITKV
jgi:hypothetical protein